MDYLSLILKDIESLDFSARLLIASDFNTFIRAAVQEKSTLELNKSLEGEKVREEVFLRIVGLAGTKIDPRYSNPWDVAITIFLWLLDCQDSRLSKIVSEVVLSTQNTWWARKLALHILMDEQYLNDAAYDQSVRVYLSHKSSLINLESAESLFASSVFDNYDIEDVNIFIQSKSNEISDSPVLNKDILIGCDNCYNIEANARLSN